MPCRQGSDEDYSQSEGGSTACIKIILDMSKENGCIPEDPASKPVSSSEWYSASSKYCFWSSNSSSRDHSSSSISNSPTSKSSVPSSVNPSVSKKPSSSSSSSSGMYSPPSEDSFSDSDGGRISRKVCLQLGQLPC